MDPVHPSGQTTTADGEAALLAETVEPTPDGPSRSPASQAAVVAAVSLATSLVMAFVVSRGGSAVDGGFDPYSFGEMGRSIADGNGFEGFGNLITRRAPAYPIFVGGIFWAFGDHVNLVLFAHCLMFMATALLVWDLGRRHFNPRTGLIAGVLMSLHPLLLRYIPSLHLETQLTLLFTLMVWCTYRFYRTPTIGNGVLVGVSTGLAALTKAVALPYAAVFIVAVLLSVRAARRRGDDVVVPWKGFLAIVLTLGITIMPWTIRNYGTTGHFVLISSGTSDAFLRGTIFSRLEFATLQEPPYTFAEIESNQYFERLSAEAGTVWQQDDYETDQILNDEAMRVVREEPGTVVRKSFVGLFTFWYQLTSLKNSLLVMVCAIGAWALAIVGWVRARRLGIAVWPFLLPVFYLNVALALLLALGRYSAPVLPALMIVSAFGVDTLLERWRPQRA